MAMNTQLMKLLDIDIPIIQAPMAGASGSRMAVAVSNAGALGSLPCASLQPDTIRSDYLKIKNQTQNPVNLNFFCHQSPCIDSTSLSAWEAVLSPHFSEQGVEQPPTPSSNTLASFNTTLCEVVEDLKPAVVSFHFGLPEASLLNRVKATQCKVLSTATTLEEARWLEHQGCDAIIAQGIEAGGHRGLFLSDGLSSQLGTLSLVPQMVDAVEIPVIAAGGIADSRGINAALALGASGVQIGTAFLLSPESLINPLYRAAIQASEAGCTAVTEIFTGRPARAYRNRLVRELEPVSASIAPFPMPATLLSPLKTHAESKGSTDFTALWMGQSATLTQSRSAADLIRQWWSSVAQ